MREYWIVDPDRRAVTVFHLRGGKFGPGLVFSRGEVISAVLPGLAVNVTQLFEF
jgi:Uma2 family endonuclease